MTNHRLGTSASVLRATSSIALAIALLTGVRGGPAPAFADPEVDFPVGPLPVFVDASSAPVEPAARIQVVIQTIDVVNDRESWLRGDADIQLTTNIWRCTGVNPPCSASENNEAVLLAEDKKNFDGAEGNAVHLNRVIPQAGDELTGPLATVDGGIAVFDGQRYLLQINGYESDGDFGGDFMGGVQRVIDKSNEWAVGTYTREPAAPFEDTSLPGRGGLCAGCGGIIVGDYLVTYEIRLMPLPDMHPKSMSVKTPGGPQPQVCAMVENLGAEAAEAYGMIFTVDGDPTSRISGRLNPNQTSELCVPVDPIAVGDHTLGITVDPDRAIAESNEKNNVYSRQYVRRVIDDVVGETVGVLEQADDSDTGQPPILREPVQGITTTGPATTTGGSTSPGPIQTAPAPKADMKLSAIRVKGKNPSGQSDCDPGDNDVTVVLKNQGNGPAANLLVRLEIDGKDKDTQEKSLASVNAGQEQSLTFDDVELKSDDEHKLLATILTRKTATEPEDNLAELEVKVSCKDEKN